MAAKKCSKCGEEKPLDQFYKHTIEDILALMQAQRGRCVYCLCDISKSFQVDHIVPVSLGGSNDKSNLQLLCKPCNLDKRAQDPDEYIKTRAMREKRNGRRRKHSRILV